ncbi:prolyl oligopeptidase family serine peptidase [Streptomyces sp. NPDC002619]|uniref:prolyl oligopeptidase family serine peptidase n=1 Tax=Streptomyces sp. NPDC002619 TaxID=3364655 RepID=UPI00367D26BC
MAHFTSRDIGVADVNCGGMPGCGRAYRERLWEQWGAVDMEDRVAAPQTLADEGVADRSRLAIRGCRGSGFTAAAFLVTTDMYACAALLFPELDLEALPAGGTKDSDPTFRSPDRLLHPVA